MIANSGNEEAHRQTESHTDDIQIDSLRWATKQSLHAIRVEKKDRLPYTYRHAIA